MTALAPPLAGTRSTVLPPPRVPGREQPPRPADELERRRDLRHMKRLATGLLLGAVCIFVVTRLLEDEHSWVGIFRATAEAAMVGALADWFAVTALFRHPLGIPIPHTAIIPSNKDRIGRSLGLFIQQNFFAPDQLSRRVADAHVARRLGIWLCEPANAERAATAIAKGLPRAAELLDDHRVTDAVSNALLARARSAPAAPLLARALEVAVEEGHHRVVVDSVLRGTGTYLDEHRDILRQRLKTESPWWVPEAIDDRIFEKVVGAAKRFIGDLLEQPDHEFRKGIDERLLATVGRLRTDPELIAIVEQRKEELLDHPAVRDWLDSLWSELQRQLVRAADDPTSELRTGLMTALEAAGQRLRDDPQVQVVFDGWITNLVRSVAADYGGRAADYITTTVAQWDAKQTSDLLEVQVGRDLQFIRINGTIVGGLVGLLIYLFGQLL